MRPDLVATDNSAQSARVLRARCTSIPACATTRALRYLIDTCRRRPVMLGTDYPFPLGEQEPGAASPRSALDEAEQARLYHGTALEWLGLPSSRFAVNEPPLDRRLVSDAARAARSSTPPIRCARSATNS